MDTRVGTCTRVPEEVRGVDSGGIRVPHPFPLGASVTIGETESRKDEDRDRREGGRSRAQVF